MENEKIYKAICDSIKEHKWLYITYLNGANRTTFYWCAIKDIEVIEDKDTKRLSVDIFNISVDDKTKSGIMYLDRILEAEVLDFTTYETPENLIKKLESDNKKYSFLGYGMYDNNILLYLADCNKRDNDPYITKYIYLEGIDTEVLLKNDEVILNNDQQTEMYSYIMEYSNRSIKTLMRNLVISYLSLEQNTKKYVINYYSLGYDPKNKKLKIVDKDLIFNYSFMSDESKYNLSSFIDMSNDDFEKLFKEDKDEAIQILIDGLYGGFKICTRPDILILERKITTDLISTYEKIAKFYSENRLRAPLKSFFGSISVRNNRKIIPNIVINDSKVDSSQMRVIYNAIKQPVTFVQGPPVTGKTQTILNVILSSFFNKKTVLVCSNNNKPVDGIIEKFSFKYNSKEVCFPYLRLGNITQNKKAIKLIKDLYFKDFNEEIDETRLESIRNEMIKNNFKLVDFLGKFEKIENYKNSLKVTEEFLNRINQKEDKKLYAKTKEILDQTSRAIKESNFADKNEFKKYFIPANQSNEYGEYLYFESMKYLRKLKNKEYKDLIDIVLSKDDKKRVGEFNNWLSIDYNLKLLEKVFPVIFCTNQSCSRLGQCETSFDLVIMDESSQCNVATSLLPIARAESLLLVGDPNQLKPIIVMDPKTNEKLMRKYNIGENYNYYTNSIYTTMQAADRVSMNIMLRYHYRCGKKIIGFSNARFYDNKLLLDYLKNDGNIELVNVKSIVDAPRNSSFEEAQSICNYIKRNDLKDAMVITPFRNQKHLINDMLEEEKIDDITCGTIHAIQGDEKNTIILAPAISKKTSKKTYDWIKNNESIINVATTRAKDRLVMIADEECIDALSDGKDDLSVLCKYIKANGNYKVEPNLNKMYQYGKSNGSLSEDELYKTISEVMSRFSKHIVERNVPLNKIITDPRFIDNKQEFDMVIYTKKYLFKKVPLLCIELDGGEHLGTYNRERNDVLKSKILSSYGIKLLRIPNDRSKDYETLKELINKIIKEQKDDEYLPLFNEKS